MPRPIRWLPDDGSAAILAAYARRREPLRSVLRRALRLLAAADGIIDGRGQVRGRRQEISPTHPTTHPESR